MTTELYRTFVPLPVSGETDLTGLECTNCPAGAHAHAGVRWRHRRGGSVFSMRLSHQLPPTGNTACSAVPEIYFFVT